MENDDSFSSGNYSEEEVLFNYIANQDENKINNYLGKKSIKFMISGIKTEKIQLCYIHLFIKKILIL